MKVEQVLISAENKKQAEAILDTLLKKKLVIGGLVIQAPAKFWWKGKIVRMPYCNILTFALQKNRKAIIRDVEKSSLEEVPMVAFSKAEGNKKFTDWILNTLTK